MNILTDFLAKRRLKKTPLNPSEFKSLCPCGAVIKADFGTPKRFKESVSKFTCHGCGSQFMAITRKTPGTKNKFHTYFKILRLSAIAKTKVMKRIRR